MRLADRRTGGPADRQADGSRRGKRLISAKKSDFCPLFLKLTLAQSVHTLYKIIGILPVSRKTAGNGSGGLGWFVSSCLDSKLPSIASVYSRMEKRADKYYAGVVDFYRSINE